MSQIQIAYTQAKPQIAIWVNRQTGQVNCVSDLNDDLLTAKALFAMGSEILNRCHLKPAPAGPQLVMPDGSLAPSGE